MLKSKDCIKKKAIEYNSSEESINEQLNIANNLFLEANKKLAKAVEKKDLVQIGVAQAMLESAQSKSLNIQKELSHIRSKQKELDKKRQNIIDNALSAPKAKMSKK